MKSKFNLIQTFRGLAALMIVFTHTTAATIFYFKGEWLRNLFRIGWCGVDFFFVLSGFIITHCHLNDVRQRKNLVPFLIKRFNRIYPIFWVVSCIYFILSVAAKQHALSDAYSSSIIKSFLLIPTANPLIGVSWSLCYEVLFYLVFAACIFWGWRITKWLAAVWFVATFLLNLFNVVNLPHIVNGWVIEFLLGSLTGYLFDAVVYQNKRFTVSPALILVVGCVLFFGMWVHLYGIRTESRDLFESRIVFGSASALIVFGAAMMERNRPVQVPSFFLVLGDASYVLYLMHPLVLTVFYKAATHYFATSASSTQLFLLGAAAALSAIIIGVLFHKYAEKPLTKTIKRLTLSSSKKNSNFSGKEKLLKINEQ